MSNSQEQSLNENVVFLPVDVSCPEFLYCEEEREAVERLLNGGPEAFYSSVGLKSTGCFLSPEEVGQITSWAQNYHLNPPPVEEESGVQNGSEMEDFCSTYFPKYSDVPPPGLELGWPVPPRSGLKASVSVHTSPPAEGEPPVREIIRRHLQKARKVIAIVTDGLTDSAVIGDLHNAASRSVPVYIILNQRSFQENFTLSRLRHPNMRVRILGGKTFCSRSGRMVVGELKDNFLLVDLESVIHGSYSLTWTDAHLHRQLVTVLTGPAVDLFDKEFRILFAASVPASEPLRAAETNGNEPLQLRYFSHLRSHEQLRVEPEITTPSSPPTDSVLDWDAMGVVQGEYCQPASALELHEKVMANEMIPQHSCDDNRPRPSMDRFTHREQQLEEQRSNTEHLSRNPPATERVKRPVHSTARQLSTERNRNLQDITRARLNDKAPDPVHLSCSTMKWQPSNLTQGMKEDREKEEESTKANNSPNHRRPIILRIPQPDSCSSVSDIMKRFPQRTSGLLRTEQNSTMSERTQSMLDLSKQSLAEDPGDRSVPVPRFQASHDRMTPALALMKKRNDELKSSLFRTSQIFAPKETTHSSDYVPKTDWRRLLAKREGEYE
ncbi:unnamed protein product [Menidia menidia]|uniref:(Atlantic silverside) hypothetical protein n=1 Tax=Menidia menidia TaxID=238744 RepID=A0A8S4BIR5_9TELE|nr:unnamed protein product [Menidia menidia]